MKIKTISKSFSQLSDELLGKLIEHQTSTEEEILIINSIGNETDLWILKNIIRISETES